METDEVRQMFIILDVLFGALFCVGVLVIISSYIIPISFVETLGVEQLSIRFSLLFLCLGILKIHVSNFFRKIIFYYT